MSPSPLTGPASQAQAADQKLKDQELNQFKLSMDALKKRLSDPQAREKQLKGACRNFEAVFIGKLWEQMRATVPREGYLHGPQEDMYLSMFDQAFSEKMADAGGIGLADMLYGHLAERLKDMGRSALPGRMGEMQAPPEIKPLAESGRDPRQESAKPVQDVRHTDLKPLRRQGEPLPLAPRRRQEAPAAPASPAAAQSAPAAKGPGPVSEAPAPAASVAVAETPEQVAAQLEALIRHIETSEGAATAQAPERPAAGGEAQPQPVAGPVPAGLRTYRGQQLGQPQRAGRKIAKVG